MAVARRNDHVVYEDEFIRLKSFENKSWLGTEIEPCVYAKAGFFYTGQGDVIKCPFCFVEVKNIKNPRREMGKQLPVLHAVISSSCKFITEKLGKGIKYPHCDAERPTRQNILVEASENWISPTFETKVKYPSKNNYDARLETLKNFPKGDLKERLAEAGFFYTPDSDSSPSDKVTCFWCDGYLNEWTDTDEPWEEHAIHYPGCSYVRKTRGTNFILSMRLTTKKEIPLDYEYNGSLRILVNNYPAYDDENSRCESFTGCKNKDDFSKMGFHQVEENYMMCYQCGLILNKTSESSAVKADHFRLSENCQMVNGGPAMASDDLEGLEIHAGIRCNYARRNE